jgi:hypothetical protein
MAGMLLHGSCGPVTYPVKLKVYDLSRGVCRKTSGIVLGKTIDSIYHAGIDVYGREYWFGPAGILCAPSSFFESSNDMPPLEVHQTTTTRHQAEFESFLRENESRFTRENYNLSKNNCNNFAQAVSSFLTNGQRIPAYITWQVREISTAPHASRLLPLMDIVSKSMTCGFNIDETMERLDLGRGRGGRLGMSKVGIQAFREMLEAVQYSLSGQSQMVMILNPFGDSHTPTIQLPREGIAPYQQHVPTPGLTGRYTQPRVSV